MEIDSAELSSIKMVPIRGGTFQMGSQSEDAEKDEQPIHQVTLNDFYIGKYPVTQGEWRAVMRNSPSHIQYWEIYWKLLTQNCKSRWLDAHKSTPWSEVLGLIRNSDSINFENFDFTHFPVESVSWDDVQQFITKLNQLTGKRYRLPTEAEWEYAARGGTAGDRYGNLESIAWYNGYPLREEDWGDKFESSPPIKVGCKDCNAYGLYDMLGNVFEWCSDWYGPYSAEAKTNPIGPASGYYRVIRGGSISSKAMDVRAPYRGSWNPASHRIDLGFRLAMD